jgi:NitT/TauT family transport system substrate-binding protein
VSPWPGYAGHYVAMAKGFFQEAGVDVKEISFASQTESDTAFLAGRSDLNWTGLPNVVPQISKDPSIKVVFQCDYSNGADGIIGRNIKSARDLKGQKVARENVLFEELLLRKYLEEQGLTRTDVETLDMAAADAATAFAAGKVDVAVTYEPWMSKAAKDGKGDILFTSQNTNIIPDGILARDQTIAGKQAAVAAYLKAIDKAVALIRAEPELVSALIAKGLGVAPAEVAPQIAGVKLYDLGDNKAITFNRKDAMNLYDSIEFASKTALEMKLTTKLIDVNAALDQRTVHSL